MGYFYRFMRFWAKLAPVIGIIGWLMASSGQGSLPEVFELVKQWTGISTGGGGAGGVGGGGQAPGIAQLAGMFGLGPQAQSGSGSSSKRNTRSSTKRKAKSGTGSGAGGLADAGADIADILRSATGTQSNEDWQDVAQGYVKQAVAKAAGLEWLFGGQQAQQPPAERRRTR